MLSLLRWFRAPLHLCTSASPQVPRDVNCVPLLVVRSIGHPKGKGGKDETQFEVEAQDSKSGELRNYLFKAKNAAERTRWVKGLNAHRDFFLKMLRRSAIDEGAGINVER